MTGSEHTSHPTALTEDFLDPVTRRHFLKIMSASFLLAGIGSTGCRRPTETIPASATEPDFAYGEPQYFATAMPEREFGIPLLVKSIDAHPIKIEGNPRVPGFNGGTDAFAQASILGLYDPDRAKRFAFGGEPRSRKEAMDFLATLASRLGTGKGVAVLSETTSSPSCQRLRNSLEKKFPEMGWFTYDPVDFDVHKAAATAIFGKPIRPRYKPAKASVILALDCDFLGMEEPVNEYVMQFSNHRQLHNPEKDQNRLYCVESLYSLTGSNADHRLAVSPSLLTAVAAQFALEILGERRREFPHLEKLGQPAVQYLEWIIPCARDLLDHKSQSLIFPGHRLSPELYALIIAMNEVLEASGKTVEYVVDSAPSGRSLSELAKLLSSDEIQTLVLLDSNPFYNAPVDLNWPVAQSRAKTVLRLGSYEDESSGHTGQWDFPAAHYLESWGDARTSDGTLLAIQPLMEPLFGGVTQLEFLSRLGALGETDPLQIVKETVRQITSKSDAESWTQFLRNGFVPVEVSKPAIVHFDWSKAVAASEQLSSLTAPSTNQMEIVFHRDYRVDDGRFSNNGWLQELPDPVTKLTWDNAILVNPLTAQRLGFKVNGVNYSVIDVHLDGKTIRGPVLPQQGMADNTLGLALGYGRKKAGRVGTGVGYDAYLLRSSSSMHYAYNAVVNTTDTTYPLAVTQGHFSAENRPILFETTPKALSQKTSQLKASASEKHPAQLYSNPLDEQKKTALHQWGMSIDLNRCIGCSACVIACQSENNIPLVGKKMVIQSREMHWLRIDRYHTGTGKELHTVSQPMLCQHCENAPCEVACPVNATNHDNEGLNVMVYRRCVGSRFCANNCPFKVRRFNFFDYNRQSLDQLYKSPLASKTDGEWNFKRWLKNPDRGNLPEDEWQLARLSRNPNVTVRMRGVMEKCSFCQQRIQQTRIGEKTGLPTPILQTACQQACPAKAIEFGDINHSPIAELKTDVRSFESLPELNLRTRVSYLAKVHNPNRQMPNWKGGA